MARWPVDPVRVTQEFGANALDAYRKWGFLGHTGTDLAIVYAQLIKAPAPLSTLFAGPDNTGFGNLYMGRDPWGYTHLLAHNLDFLVRSGSVAEGQPVARGDSSGNSTGNHCHWEIWPANRNPRNGYNGGINPRDWLALINNNMAVSQDAFNAQVQRAEQAEELLAEMLYLYFLHEPTAEERRMRVGKVDVHQLYRDTAWTDEGEYRRRELTKLLFTTILGRPPHLISEAEYVQRSRDIRDRKYSILSFIRELEASAERKAYLARGGDPAALQKAVSEIAQRLANAKQIMAQANEQIQKV